MVSPRTFNDFLQLSLNKTSLRSFANDSPPLRRVVVWEPSKFLKCSFCPLYSLSDVLEKRGLHPKEIYNICNLSKVTRGAFSARDHKSLALYVCPQVKAIRLAEWNTIRPKYNLFTSINTKKYVKNGFSLIVPWPSKQDCARQLNPLRSCCLTDCTNNIQMNSGYCTKLGLYQGDVLSQKATDVSIHLDLVSNLTIEFATKF